jgi:hypothetical protein
LNVTFTSPPTAAFLRIRFAAALGTSYRNWQVGDVLYGDALMLTKGSTLYPYRDGSFTDAKWVGTADASQSVAGLAEPVFAF